MNTHDVLQPKFTVEERALLVFDYMDGVGSICRASQGQHDSDPTEVIDEHDATCSLVPSECRCKDASWLWADYAGHKEPRCDRSGKWMIFPSSEEVDFAWTSVVDLLVRGKLGRCAKVSTIRNAGDGGSQVICVYTADHDNLEDVYRVLHALRHIPTPVCTDLTLGYKTDEATIAGLYTTSDAAKREGFDGEVSATRDKRMRISKYSSPSIRGNDYVRMERNNVLPDYRSVVVAELAIDATPEEMKAYFKSRSHPLRRTGAAAQQRTDHSYAGRSKREDVGWAGTQYVPPPRGRADHTYRDSSHHHTAESARADTVTHQRRQQPRAEPSRADATVWTRGQLPGAGKPSL